MNSGNANIPPSPTGLDYAQAERMVIERRVRSGADWFFWIAGLTLIGTVASLFFHATFGFALGLGTTYVVEGIAQGVAQSTGGGSVANIVAFVIDLVILGIYCLFGVFGRKGIPAAFIVGMIFYALDTLVFLIRPAQAVLSLVFHAYALYCLFNGFKAAQALRALNARQAAMQAATPYAEPAQPGVWPPPPGMPNNP